MKKATDVEEKIKAIIYDKLRIEEKKIKPEMRFIDDIGADSLDMVDLLMEFEKEFDITIPDDDTVNISTVGQAIDYITMRTRSLQRSVV